MLKLLDGAQAKRVELSFSSPEPHIAEKGNSRYCKITVLQNHNLKQHPDQRYESVLDFLSDHNPLALRKVGWSFNLTIDI